MVGFRPGGTATRWITDGFSEGNTAADAQRYGNALATILKSARRKVGIMAADEDVYPSSAASQQEKDSWWGEAVTEAVNDLVSEMGTKLLPVQTRSYPVTGAGEYDLMSDGFVRIDRVGYGVATSITWLPLAERSDALAYTPNSTVTGLPWRVYRSGVATIGFLQVPNDTGQRIFVEGPRLPRTLVDEYDRTDLPSMLNEIVALGTAQRVCRDDGSHRADLRAQFPILRAEWTEKVHRMKNLLRSMARNEPGMGIYDPDGRVAASMRRGMTGWR